MVVPASLSLTASGAIERRRLEETTMIRTTAAALLMTLGFAVVPAFAAESSVTAAAASAATATAAAAAGSSELAADTDWTLAPAKMGVKESRGAVLPSLYVSLAALNAYDFASTRKGLAMGATEGNPAMKAIVGNTTSLMAVKAVATAGTILAAEKLWKNHHKGQAIAVMLISNGLMSAVAAHNSAVVDHLGR